MDEQRWLSASWTIYPMQFRTLQRKQSFKITLCGEIVNGILFMQFHKNLSISIYNTGEKLKLGWTDTPTRMHIPPH
jgi:hypothetical protein